MVKVVFRDGILAVKLCIGEAGIRYDEVDGVKLNQAASQLEESSTMGRRCIATVSCQWKGVSRLDFVVEMRSELGSDDDEQSLLRLPVSSVLKNVERTKMQMSTFDCR